MQKIISLADVFSLHQITFPHLPLWSRTMPSSTMWTQSVGTSSRQLSPSTHGTSRLQMHSLPARTLPLSKVYLWQIFGWGSSNWNISTGSSHFSSQQLIYALPIFSLSALSCQRCLLWCFMMSKLPSCTQWSMHQHVARWTRLHLRSKWIHSSQLGVSPVVLLPHTSARPLSRCWVYHQLSSVCLWPVEETQHTHSMSSCLEKKSTGRVS